MNIMACFVKNGGGKGDNPFFSMNYVGSIG